jgi:hypothetical protein
MRAGIMQPYFLPYLGYFQLLGAVDVFVLYDNIKYTKKGWINRNRFLQNGHAAMLTLPLKRDVDDLDVRERSIADTFNRQHILGQIENAYRLAPEFERVFPLVEAIVCFPERNLFRFIEHSLRQVCVFLGLRTPIVQSSGVPIDHGLRGQEKVLALCAAVGATCYINAIGGIDLYSASAFHANNIQLRFIKMRSIEYPQLGEPFVPLLSIIDVLMFNSLDAMRGLLGSWDLVPGR